MASVDDQIVDHIVICVDNSGGMSQSNLDSQIKAILMIVPTLLEPNLGNKVGIMTLSNEPKTIQTLTNDLDIIIEKLIGISTEIGGKINFIFGIRTAISELKIKAENKVKKRIIAFVGSYFKPDTIKLKELAKELNEENLVIDIVNFGLGVETNNYALNTFKKELSNSCSHLFNVNRPELLSLRLIGSPILESNADQNEDIPLNSYPKFDPDFGKMNQKQNIEMKRDLLLSTLENENNQDFEQKVLEMVIKESLKDIKSDKETEEIGFPSDPQNIIISDMTEEEQIAYALKISLYQINNELQQKEKSSDNNRANKMNEVSKFESNNSYKKQQKICKKFREGKDET
jgi:hypothetical protein